MPRLPSRKALPRISSSRLRQESSLSTTDTESTREDKAYIDDEDDECDDDVGAHSGGAKRRGESFEASAIAGAEVLKSATGNAAEELGMGAGAGVTSARGKRLSCIDHLLYTPGTLTLQ